MGGESGRLLGLKQRPADASELNDALERFESELVVSDDTKEVIQWIHKAPLPGAAKVVYKLLFQAAYLTLDQRHQKMIGIKTLPAWIIQPATRMALSCMTFMLGDNDPLQDAARDRLARWKKSNTSESS